MREKIERLDFDVEVLDFVALFTENRTSREHFSSDFQFFKLFFKKLVELKSTFVTHLKFCSSCNRSCKEW